MDEVNADLHLILVLCTARINRRLRLPHYFSVVDLSAVDFHQLNEYSVGVPDRGELPLGCLHIDGPIHR